MITFKQFIELRENLFSSNNRKIPAVYIGSMPYRYVNESVDEPTYDELEKLHNSLSKEYQFNSDEIQALHDYGHSSHSINLHLCGKI